MLIRFVMRSTALYIFFLALTSTYTAANYSFLKEKLKAPSMKPP